MKYSRFFLAFIVATCFSLDLSAGVIYVAPVATADGSGLTWMEPTSLPAALSRAQAGDQVWVRGGVYTPGNQRTASFVIPAGVHVYGGFAGRETTLAERTLGTHPTVLSGDIGTKGEVSDNSYTIVHMESRNGLQSLLDGVVIRDGYGRGFTEGFSLANAGGGLFMDPNHGGPTAHRVNNCIFIGNYAHNGGAVFISEGQPTFSNCEFRDNRADFNGGAIYNLGVARVSSPVFRNCRFDDNKSNSGAGITNDGTNGEAHLLLVACTFEDNFSLINGAAIFNLTNGAGEAEAVVEGCTFTGNDSVLGGDNEAAGATNFAPAGATAAARRGGQRGTSLRPVKR